jgi:DNA repair photolyase
MKIGITERGDAAVNWDIWYPKRHTVDGVILITKNPTGDFIDKISNLDVPWVLHCTITGWGNSEIEPNVPSHADVVFGGYLPLAQKFGTEKVVLRIDPIIPTDMRIIEMMSAGPKVLNGRSRISFLDWYPHIQNRFKEKAPQYYNEINKMYNGQLHAPLSLRNEIKNKYFPNSEICGEPGMECFGCVSARDLAAMGLSHSEVSRSKQRFACACLGIKTELLNNRHPCQHRCLYCYWKD